MAHVGAGATDHFSRNCPHKSVAIRTSQEAAQSIVPVKDSVSPIFVKGTTRNERNSTGRAVFLRATAGEQKCDCLLDTGSDVSLMPADLIPCSSMTTTTKTLKAVTRTPIPVLGEATVRIQRGDFMSTIT